ncbi:MAG TPA: hypothetical protein VI959_03040 [Alphaproteobacteria bacterium]|nr:hypothetical protein [Alphaproteobacteria bacterium]
MQLYVIGFLFLSFLKVCAHDAPKSSDEKPATKNVVEKEQLPKPPLYRLETIRFSILRRGEAIAHAQFIIDVEVFSKEGNQDPEKDSGAHEEKSEDSAALELTLVRQAFFTELYGALAYLWLPPKEPSIEVLRERLKSLAKEKFPTLIKEIFIRNFFMNQVYE